MKSGSSRSARRPRVKPASTSNGSVNDWQALRARRPAVTREHPEAELREVVRGIARQGLKPVPAKKSISLRVDENVLDWFRSRGPGYQTLMNSILRAYRDASRDSGAEQPQK